MAKRRVRVLCVLSLIFLVVRGVWRWTDRLAPGVLRVTFFDVGQGDAVLLRFPRGTVWMVDAGGGWKEWDRGRELYPELARMGVRTVDVAVLSHPDTDHGLGFRSLWEGIRVREFWWNSAFLPGEHPLLEKLLGLAAMRGTRTVPVSRPRFVDVEGAEVHAIPFPAASQTNESPLVLFLQYAGCRFLLAGDAQKKAERLLARGGWGTVDVLKANHHGSRTSSSEEFLRAFDPRWSVVSVGADNRYGHPARDVVRRFAAGKRRLLRTDTVGYVEFTVTQDGLLSCRSAEGSCGEALCARKRSALFSTAEAGP